VKEFLEGDKDFADLIQNALEILQKNEVISGLIKKVSAEVKARFGS